MLKILGLIVTSFVIGTLLHSFVLVAIVLGAFLGMFIVKTC